MKNLFKFFLIIMVFNNIIYSSYKNRPLPKPPKEYRKPDQSKPLPKIPKTEKDKKGKKEKEPEFFIIRFAETGNKEADKKLNELLINRSAEAPLLGILVVEDIKDVPGHIRRNTPRYFMGNHKLNIRFLLGDRYFNEKFKINEDIVIPIEMLSRLVGSLELYVSDLSQMKININNVRRELDELPVEKGKKYIFRNRKCTEKELKQPDKFVQLNSEGYHKLNLCVEIQDIAEQQQKLKAELVQALPDMLPELRNIVQEYVGTDIT